MNFNIKPTNKSICDLTVNQIENLNVDVWLLSPPCQPYTKGGNLLDDKDERSKPFLHLIKLLKMLKNPPKFIFLENLFNFEVNLTNQKKSQSRHLFIECLNLLGYSINEFLLSSLHFGIPNDRKRYYLTAKLDLKSKNAFHTTFPFEYQIKELSYFLDDSSNLQHFLIPSEHIKSRVNFRYGIIILFLDIVSETDQKSSTFTKAYGSKYIVGILYNI